MHTRSNRHLAVLVALTLPLGGCSWIFMSKAPEPVVAPNYPVDCTNSNAAPILDTICSAYFVVNGIYLLAIPDCANASFGARCAESGTKYAGAAVSAGLAVLCGISAGSGYPAATRCQEVKNLNARCITGDMAACQRLTPGWVPPQQAPWPGAQPPPAAPPPPAAQPPPPGAPPPPPGAQPPPQAPPPPPPAAPAPGKAAATPSIDPDAYRAAVAAAAR